MSERIKSLVGCYVRIKRKYIVAVPDYDDNNWGSTHLEGTPFNSFFDDGELTSQLYNDDSLEFGSQVPQNWVGRVHAHIYGIDILPSNYAREEPKNMLVIDGFPNKGWTYAWDAEYFEVVKSKTVSVIKWEVDEEYI